jgi:hypothetical protein
LKPSSLKPNRIDRLDRLELIMADQETLGMNGASRRTPRPEHRDNLEKRSTVLPHDIRESRTPQKRS